MNDTQIANTLGQLTGVPDLTAIESPVANYAMFGQMDFTHPLFAPFADPRFGNFKIRFWKHRKLSIEKLPGVRVIARYDDNDPAILEIPVRPGDFCLFHIYVASNGQPVRAVVQVRAHALLAAR